MQTSRFTLSGSRNTFSGFSQIENYCSMGSWQAGLRKSLRAKLLSIALPNQYYINDAIRSKEHVLYLNSKLDVDVQDLLKNCSTLPILKDYSFVNCIHYNNLEEHKLLLKATCKNNLPLRSKQHRFICPQLSKFGSRIL